MRGKELNHQFLLHLMSFARMLMPLVDTHMLSYSCDITLGFQVVKASRGSSDYFCEQLRSVTLLEVNFTNLQNVPKE